MYAERTLLSRKLILGDKLARTTIFVEVTFVAFPSWVLNTEQHKNQWMLIVTLYFVYFVVSCNLHFGE